MSIPEEFKINDIRALKDFSEKTFSGYLKSDVYKALFNAITEFKIEETCNWCIELVVSQQTDKLYEKFILYYAKYININNPKLPERLYKRYKTFINSKLSNYDVINSQVIRNHLTELSLLLCLSNKTKSITLPKIKNDDFVHENLLKNLKANDKNLINHSIKFNDPEEIKLILNELWYCVTIKKLNLVLYWLSWIITYEKILIKKKKQLMCAERKIEDIPKKFYGNFVWLLWDIIIKEANYKLDHDKNSQIQNLFNLYKKNYKKSKPVHIIINAIMYFTNNYTINKSICNSNNVIIQAVAKINLLYQHKKKYQIVNKTIVGYEKEPKIKEKEKEKNKHIKKIVDKQNLVSNIDNLMLNI